jgi:beta-glucosidase-like glycosyl hydrolase/CubicO group peptidase (beta-lactamase class C family)
MKRGIALAGILSVVFGFFIHKEYKKNKYLADIQAIKEQEIKRQFTYHKAQNQWADSILTTLTDDEKIAQLFMVAAWSNKDEKHYKEIDLLVEKHKIGGIIFFQGSPHKHAELTNRYQAKSKVPMLTAIDGEWGLGMRLDSTISFPRAMIVGAIQDDKLIYEMGTEIARQCKRLGIHVNFAPVADVNSNAANPVIGTRSFGENKDNVARKAAAYMRGLQHNGVIANAKHFPGHGDTDTDSHYTLPLIRHDQNRLHNIELYPFKQLIADSLMSVMVAHINVPSLDSTKNLPTTLSPNVVRKLLIDSLQFKGLIFTDGLNMQGMTKFYKTGEIEVKALQAGNDILLYPADVVVGIAAIKKAIADSTLTMKMIEQKVKKLLQAKYFVGLNKYKPIETKNLYQDLNTPQAKALREKLYQQAVTIVKNENNLLPFVKIDNIKFASVAIGANKFNDFQRILSKYAKFDNHLIGKNESESNFNKIAEKAKKADVIIVSLHNVDVHKPKTDFGISENSKKFIEDLEKTGKKIIVVHFGNAYGLKYFENSKYLVCAYEDDNMMRKAVPQVLFGAIANHALLPVSASSTLKEGMGQPIPFLNRLQYSDIPENVDMSAAILQRIDTIANYAIEQRATPSCQVLVARKGKVIFSRSYGFHTYEAKDSVTDETLYDLASLTKVTATMQAFMLLWEQNKIDVNKKISFYLPELRGTNKEEIKIIDILTHTAGLAIGDPLWTKTTFRNWRSDKHLSVNASDTFSVQITNKLYAHQNIKEEVWNWIVAHEQRAAKRNPDGTYRYQYTDVGYYLFLRLIEKLTNQSLDSYAAKTFYEPLGLNMTYKPLQHYNTKDIAPTEKDTYFRHQEVQGTVHDPDAALMGGVAGHAGVFANANDVAVLMQMNLQKGVYGGRRYFNSDTTIQFFAYNRQNEKCRRGLGWDKPKFSSGGLCSKFCSQQTFGHTGFTGTAVWVDPTYDLVYIFLANRSYPNASNRKLNHLGIRNLIHNVVYESMGFKTQYVYLEKGATKPKKRRGRR